MEINGCYPPETEQIMGHIKEQFGLNHFKREGIHVSDLLLCLRASYWDKVSPIEPSDEELTYFIRGLALQEVLLRGVPSMSITVDGIVMTPDYYRDGVLAEVKTTLISKKRLDAHNFPEHWIKQIMAYCYGFRLDSALLIVMPMLWKSTPLTYQLDFTIEELEDNWGWLCMKATALANLLCAHPGEVFEYPATTDTWQCKNCRYQLRCMSRQLLGDAPVDAMVDRAIEAKHEGGQDEANLL